MNATKVMIQVEAGLIIGQAIDELTKTFSISSSEWEEAGAAKQMELLAQRNGAALGYAMLLMLQPNSINWVDTKWVWL